VITGIAHADRDRVAMTDGAGQITYRELAALRTGGRPRSIASLPVSGTLDDVVALLARAATGERLLVMDAAATTWEAARSAALFQEAVEDAGAGPVFGLATSGTSGLPKVVTIEWPDGLANALAFADALGIGAGDVVWCTTPVHHRYGLVAGVLGTLSVGGTVLLTPGLVGPAELPALLLGNSVTVVLSVPYLYGLYVRELQRSPDLLRRWEVRCCVTAGAMLPASLAAGWRTTTGLSLISHYGSTEDGQITLGRGDWDEGVGRPIPGSEVRISTSGEVLVRREGAAAWRRTGDSGHLDPRGNLHLTGRIGDRLNVAGRKVDPAEVEEALRAHPHVADCAVAGVPGATGDEIVAFIVTSAPVPDASLRHHLSGMLSPYKLPRRFARVAEVPRTRTGKTRRGALIESLITAAAQA
jgi:acyl-coenzyme A synthetase/AMP-(fatty) acid ligase